MPVVTPGVRLEAGGTVSRYTFGMFAGVAATSIHSSDSNTSSALPTVRTWAPEAVARVACDGFALSPLA